MKAARLKQKGTYPTWDTIEQPKSKEGEVVVQVGAAALNRRDYWITQGLYPGLKFPVTLGSDLCGRWNGQNVVVNPGMQWGQNLNFQSDLFNILGMPRDGALAEYCRVPRDTVFSQPDHLNIYEAAALPLAGVTAYRALFTKGQLEPTSRVLITGIGGGVATMALQMALAHEAEVYVTSSSAEKINKAIDLGAVAGFCYMDDDYEKELFRISGGIDLIIDGAAGEGLSGLISTVNPGGQVVLYGGTRGKIPFLNPQLIFWRQITLKGTTMGSEEDFQNMLSFVNYHKITPVIDHIYSRDDLTAAFEAMKEGSQFGKIVIDMQE